MIIESCTCSPSPLSPSLPLSLPPSLTHSHSPFFSPSLSHSAISPSSSTMGLCVFLVNYYIARTVLHCTCSSVRAVMYVQCDILRCTYHTVHILSEISGRAVEQYWWPLIAPRNFYYKKLTGVESCWNGAISAHWVIFVIGSTTP